MGRPRTTTDEAILDALTEVLRAKGTRFSLAEVGRRAGLSPATLLQRFGSKRGLVLAFAHREAERAREPFERARRLEASPLDALARVLLTGGDAGNRHDELTRSLSLLAEDVADPELRVLAARHARETERAIAELLREAVRAGQLVGIDPDQRAALLMDARGGALIQYMLRGTGSVEAFLRARMGHLLEPAERGA